VDYLLLIIEVIILVGLSAIFSGLNISLMSLDIDDLKRKKKLGDRRAARVLPYRQNAHLSLASILFTNIAVVSATSLILEPHFHGLIAGLISTLLIVVFGEVLPQAFFVRFALDFCSVLAPVLRVTIIVTYIISKPLQLLLDAIVSKEERNLHSRDELGMIIAEHRQDISSELDDDEVDIIQGALQLSEKRVGDIVEPINEVYWLPHTATLNASTVDEIKARGYSRVPVFDSNLTMCYGILLMKDMVDIDFDEEPRPVLSFPLHKTELIGSRTALDTMLRRFFTLKTHLVPIERDDKIIGILTVEDLFEEIIGREIADETDQALKRE
jgi:metal transporter CNNM